MEEQAFDRAHRLGQKRDVHIRKLSVPHTVEQRILEVLYPCIIASDSHSCHQLLQLQEKKRALAQAALSGDKIKNMKLGLDDLMTLFRHGGDDRDDDDEDE